MAELTALVGALKGRLLSEGIAPVKPRP
jgi:hypothetical protein